MAAEFFELFKTPWEFWREDGHYDVLLSTSEHFRSEGVALALVFSGESDQKLSVKAGPSSEAITDGFVQLPLYGGVSTFDVSSNVLLRQQRDQRPVAFATKAGTATVVRIGYNLFSETKFLLTEGQPAINAGIATLELHINLIRDWITRSGIPLVEIPPMPAGHGFIACLTHDIDHPVLRNHWCDHTMFGFLYRSTVGSLLDVGRGKRPIKSLWRNLTAAGLLPFVHMGLAKDFWRDFDRYLEIESGHGSTFFVIPQKDRPGRSDGNGSAPAMRACRYDLAELAPQLAKIVAAGGEVGVHGIDAWLDPEAGRAEQEKVSTSVGEREFGVRMHWLYFDQGSPVALDQAGFSYDSTVGYRETVGFRAGTAQAYRPPGTATLLELPLHVMDTALFYPAYLNLDSAAARSRVWSLLAEAEKYGGALTFNWHDRSIAPERLWDDFYLQVVSELKRRGAWMPTASQAATWFRKRRSATLLVKRRTAATLEVKCGLGKPDKLPGLRLRVHKPRASSLLAPALERETSSFTDTAFEENNELSIAI